MGAPTKYRKKYCRELVEYFSVPPTQTVMKKVFHSNGSLKSQEEIVVATPLPTFEGFAEKIGVTPQTLLNWCDTHPEFFEAYTRARAKQTQICIVNGLSGMYQAQFSQFFMKNCLGFTDKTESKVEGSVKFEFDDETESWAE